MNDPFLAGLRQLKHSLDTGQITRPQYDDMYAALAKAAEMDAVRCEVDGCGSSAYIGKRCATHFDRSTLPGIVAGLRGVR